uniref:Uncharacterized protein n=1 Tax=Cacopsylla melanoneura TaxID=428564 RepID=A0A8D8PXF1_9HEMI
MFLPLETLVLVLFLLLVTSLLVLFLLLVTSLLVLFLLLLTSYLSLPLQTISSSTLPTAFLVLGLALSTRSPDGTRLSMDSLSCPILFGPSERVKLSLPSLLSSIHIFITELDSFKIFAILLTPPPPLLS